MGAFSIFSIGEIIGIFLAAWMVITGHYPLHIDKAIPTHHQKQNSGGSFALWVRMSGVFFITGIVMNAYGLITRIFGTLVIGNGVVYGIAVVALLISFPKAMHER